MEDCKNLLYNDPEKLKGKEECFLSEDHYFRGSIALTYSSTRKRIGDYVTFQAPRVLYILGIDDTTEKIFTRGVPIIPRTMSEKLSEKELRKMMGFTHHRWEVDTIKSMQTIRLQGDLAMRVEKAFSSLEKLFNYLSYYKDFGNHFIRRGLWEEFIRIKLSGDENIEKAQRLFRVREEIDQIMRRSIAQIRLKKASQTKFDELNKIKKEINSKIKEILGLSRIPTNVESLYYPKLSAMVEDFKKFVIEKEERLKLSYGHYSSPHLVQVTGVLVPPDNRFMVINNPFIILLREQDIIVTHKEHGITTFKVSKPAIVQFGTLDDFANTAFWIDDFPF